MSSRARLRATTGMLLAATALCAALPAGAAVRTCGVLVTGPEQEAGSETEARRLALASWVEAVTARYGAAHASWRIANLRSMRCARAAGGRARCVAAAAPCVISQVPPAAPKSGPAQPPPLVPGPLPPGLRNI